MLLTPIGNSNPPPSGGLMAGNLDHLVRRQAEHGVIDRLPLPIRFIAGGRGQTVGRRCRDGARSNRPRSQPSSPRAEADSASSSHQERPKAHRYKKREVRLTADRSGRREGRHPNGICRVRQNTRVGSLGEYLKDNGRCIGADGPVRTPADDDDAVHPCRNVRNRNLCVEGCPRRSRQLRTFRGVPAQFKVIPRKPEANDGNPCTRRPRVQRLDRNERLCHARPRLTCERQKNRSYSCSQAEPRSRMQVR